MSPLFLKKIDSFLAYPVSRFSAVMGPLTSKIRSEVKKPVIIRPGGLGDLIILHIALEALGKSPEQFDWIIEKRSSGWAKLHGFNYFLYDSPQHALKLLRRGYTTVINSEQYFGLSQSLAIYLKHGTAKTFGFSTNRCATLLDFSVPYDRFKSHETTEFARLVSAATDHKLISIALPVRKRLHPAKSGLVFCISGRESPTRSLDIEKMITLLKEWSRGKRITITSTPGDRHFAKQIKSLLNQDVEIYNDSFPKLCDLISSADEVLSVDGGPVHIASYYGVPTVALFTSGNYYKWAPLSELGRIAKSAQLDCQPCTVFGQTPPCPHQLKCHEIAIKA